MIVVLDYGLGNLGSIKKMVRRVGGSCEISSSVEAIADATKLVLPGVGSFDKAMQNLRSGGFLDILNQRVLRDGVPCLGICLGMQILFESSEEGQEKGLGWIKGRVRRFSFEEGSKLRIPHMGWNVGYPVRPSPLLDNMFAENRFYFVHSYHVECDDPDDVMLYTEYGYRFPSGIQRGQIYGLQFHPEKSHKFGKRIFEAFLRLPEC